MRYPEKFPIIWEFGLGYIFAVLHSINSYLHAHYQSISKKPAAAEAEVQQIAGVG
jgi:hypothetical protein